MAYASQSDIEAQNPKRTYGVATKPTATQVGEYINSIAAEIDNVLSSQGYAIPVTSPANFVTHLKQLNAYGAAALAEYAMFPEAANVGETPHGAILWKMYQAGLKALRDGEIPAGVPKSSASIGPASYATGQSDYPAPVFRMSSDDLEF